MKMRSIFVFIMTYIALSLCGFLSTALAATKEELVKRRLPDHHLTGDMRECVTNIGKIKLLVYPYLHIKNAHFEYLATVDKRCRFRSTTDIGQISTRGDICINQTKIKMATPPTPGKAKRFSCTIIEIEKLEAKTD